MSRAIIKHKKEPSIGRSKLLDKRINTKLEKRMQQIAEAEIEKNKKQKLLVRVLMGALQPPTISAITATDEDNNYTEAQLIHHQTVGRNYLLNNDGEDPDGFFRNVWYGPQIKVAPKDIQFNETLEQSYQRFGTNADIAFIDSDECGYGRTTDAIMLKGIKISGEILWSPEIATQDHENEAELIIAVFKVNPNYVFKQRDLQYLLASEDQNKVMPKRLISDILGADNDGNQLAPSTEDIKSRVFYKKFKPTRPEMVYDSTGDDIKYTPKVYNFSYYIERNEKVKYSRGKATTAGGQRKATAPLNVGDANDTIEKFEFENFKYAVIQKSNLQLNAEKANSFAPKVCSAVTWYFSDVL